MATNGTVNDITLLTCSGVRTLELTLRSYGENEEQPTYGEVHSLYRHDIICKQLAEYTPDNWENYGLERTRVVRSGSLLQQVLCLVLIKGSNVFLDCTFRKTLSKAK